MPVEFPSGAVSLDSPFYIERLPVEPLVLQELERPGSVIRIRAPRGMGKASLQLRLLERAKALGYPTAQIDFQSADQEIYRDPTTFLRWFCVSLSRQLGLPNVLDDYWDDEIGAKLSCTLYVEDYLLESLNTPLVMMLSRVEQVFEHSAIAQSFLPMLRFWHEQSKQNELFRQLRLIVSHSTESYVSLNINQSPFNVGLPVQLKPFTVEQVKTLVELHALAPFDDHELNVLMQLLGGHPQLVRIALYHLSVMDKSLSDLLEEAPTPVGLYGSQLQGLLATIKAQPKLIQPLRQVMAAQQPIQIDSTQAYRLNGLGVIVPVGDRWAPSCELYRRYFAQQNWKPAERAGLSLTHLQRENERLKQMVHIDELTQVSNRRYFEQQLQLEWNRMVRQQQPLSLLLLDIDCFKQYNDTYGHPAGDRCLYQVAQAIRRCVRRASDLTARYGGEEFAVLLPHVSARDVSHTARDILAEIRALNLPHCNTMVPTRVVTASIGIATIQPHPEGAPQALVEQADLMLYQAKHQGRDRYAVQPMDRPLNSLGYSGSLKLFFTAFRLSGPRSDDTG